MGEAKRRTATRAKAAEAKQAWEAGLSDRGRTVLRVAKRLGAALALPGACYRCAMFLRYHLVARHGIDGEAVVGFVNDGTDVAYSSHAWYEIDGLITDVALCRPEKPRFQKAGPVTILDREMAPGWSYTYHRQRPPEGRALVADLLRYPEIGPAMADAENLHLRMAAMAKSDELIRAYLDGAPDGLNYERLAADVEA